MGAVWTLARTELRRHRFRVAALTLLEILRDE